MGRRIIAIFAAALIALVGVVAVFLYARGADSRAVAANQPTTVYVSTAMVPTSTTLKDAVRSGLIVRTQVPAKAAPVGVLTNVDTKNENLLALTDIAPGEYLQASRFGTTPTGAKAIEVPQGMIAISVSLSDPAHVGSFVTPGSRIAIYDTYQIKSIGDDSKSKALNAAGISGTSMIMDDVLVIGMGDAALTPGAPVATVADSEAKPAANTGAPAFLVTVAVKPQDSVKLVHAIQKGNLYAGLRSSDLKMGTVTRVDDTNLVDLRGVLK
ncbi:Flp pilus assembly protein CpaB [Knoellia koreensis]|uniref:Flp pilus assembly protein CpaB n=1 Tax=Knoellia koreensis TaxID=2730921 RepID=A0A849HIC9_9MICO|nr:RcpC/CpaB family pilus assembly protein [Knoellia sp. DB2414S]NNM46334.1 Flp pilus assembly protein CpaB [Knoellia sp. DB2414S]